MSEAKPSPAEPKPPSNARKWVKRVVVGLLAVLFLSCAGVVCACGGVFWYVWNAEKTKRETADRLFHEALADGDMGQAYDKADPSMQKLYPREMLASLTFERGRLKVVHTTRTTHNGVEYVVVEVEVGNQYSTDIFYCTVGADGQWRLVGIASREWGLDLERAVPGEVKSLHSKTKPRGGGGFD